MNESINRMGQWLKVAIVALITAIILGVVGLFGSILETFTLLVLAVSLFQCARIVWSKQP